ncbi:ICOS ligand [Phaethornis superciliosus]
MAVAPFLMVHGQLPNNDLQTHCQAPPTSFGKGSEGTGRCLRPTGRQGRGWALSGLSTRCSETIEARGRGRSPEEVFPGSPGGTAALSKPGRARKAEIPGERGRGRQRGMAYTGEPPERLGRSRLGQPPASRLAAMELPGFLLLLLHILRAVIALEEKILVSKLGDNATLSCIYPERELHLKNLWVYWQIDDQEECSVVHAMISGQDSESEQCIHFKNRTQLFWDRLEHGDFSLLLLNVSQSDEHTYKCVVLQKTEYTRMIHQAKVVLSLAASYSQPILIGPIRNSNSAGEEVTFSCRSSNGYPKPSVYWINKTDNSHLPPSELEITSHTDGTYSVFSTLKVKATSNMQIECSIENKILRENLSANYTQQNQSNGSSTESHKNLEKNGRGAQAAGIVSIVILIGLLAVITCWLWRRRSSIPVFYTGVQPNEDRGGLNLGKADKNPGVRKVRSPIQEAAHTQSPSQCYTTPGILVSGEGIKCKSKKPKGQATAEEDLPI